MKNALSGPCLVITTISICDFFENLLLRLGFHNSESESLATYTEYPTKNTTSFKVGDQVVIVGKISEVPIGQLFKDYHSTLFSKIKNENTYFFIEDYFFNISYFEIGEMYEVDSAVDPEGKQLFFWKSVSVTIEGDFFLR